jgi:hypothetical protein
MSDLVSRLRQGRVAYTLPSGPVYEGPDYLHLDAIAEITRLQKELETAREREQSLQAERDNLENVCDSQQFSINSQKEAAERLVTRLRTAREDAFEEAARFFEATAARGDWNSVRISAAIRALKNQEVAG